MIAVPAPPRSAYESWASWPRDDAERVALAVEDVHAVLLALDRDVGRPVELDVGDRDPVLADLGASCGSMSIA
jgi:hypothetical protein